MRSTRAGIPALTELAGRSLVTTALVPIDGVVADRDAAQDARAVADPAVVADPDVALVDPLQADRALDLDDAVVEVDHHHAVGDDALAPDLDVLERRDRALLPQHGLGADRSRRPRARGSSSRGRSSTSARARRRASRPISSFTPGPTKHSPSVCSRPRQRSFSHAQRSAQPRVAVVEHPVRAHEAQQRERPAAQRRRLAAHLASRAGLEERVHLADRSALIRCGDAMADRSRIPRRAPARRRQARARARDLARRGRRPRGLGARARGLPAHRPRRRGRLHRAAGRGQVDADRRADRAPARPGPRRSPCSRSTRRRPSAAARCWATASA